MIHLIIGCLLEELLPSSLLEQVKKRTEIVKEILTEQELIVDSYEQVRERPGDNKNKKSIIPRGVIIHLKLK